MMWMSVVSFARAAGVTADLSKIRFWIVRISLVAADISMMASITQVGTAIEQVARSSQVLQENVESSTASIHEMGTSIAHVARNSDEVQQVAEETASAVTQMDRAIQEVRRAQTLDSKRALEG